MATSSDSDDPLVRISARTGLSRLRHMDRDEHYHALIDDSTRFLRCWASSPWGMIRYWRTVTYYSAIPHEDNSHLRYAVLLFFGAWVMGLISAKVVLALRYGYSSALDLPLIIVTTLFAILFAFEMGQTVDVISIGDFVSIDFETDGGTDDSSDD